MLASELFTDSLEPPVDINEFVAKMAEQHTNLLKVIELQNQSIQSLNQRVNAFSTTQLVVFSLLLEATDTDRAMVAQHLHAMLDNPQLTENEWSKSQLEELLRICEHETQSDVPSVGDSDKKSLPSWFQGVVDGGAKKVE